MVQIISGATDIGTTRSTNQDSFFAREIVVNDTAYSLLVVCDGMGGFEKGEVASGSVTHYFENWFMQRFPSVCAAGITDAVIRQEWAALIENANSGIKEYSTANSLRMGTTLVAVLIAPDRYYMVNVGDSRGYLVSDTARQITRDHSLVAREVQMGNLTPEEALSDQRQNILLQCVGAGDYVNPDFFFGEPKENELILLCSDGFWHKNTNEEIAGTISPSTVPDEIVLKTRLLSLIETAKERGETDNITALATVRIDSTSGDRDITIQL